MKKSLALLLTIVMAFTCFTTFASAANASPENNTGIISNATAVDKNNASVKVEITKLPDTFSQTTFEQPLSDLKTQTSLDLKIVERREVTAPATAVFPLTITFNVQGVTASSKGYFLHKLANGQVEKIDAVMGKNQMTGTFNSLSPVALVVDSDTAAAVTVATSTSTSESPKTSSDVATPFAIALVCMGALVAGFSVKKIKATNR